ncbi:hypothetical protein AGABI1DRAFT_121740 [Agaricus bisporus var. burnettii JB137-S8]|uniref:Uncharacterized protein n=2 Tax=Agaricus bisporus var. burnettii TaxID=192524 RepID=K5X5C4_AGABU|nr:uncharacterized protein AGABI1DRAFT_121740 [Agaricus bisporus var. burnettii JB137-S8]EKM78112.1 hypothetical protein AGABI1DRAFT_121740 [Agaricus bisporus var. burnettii JB137-S8]KAF7773256.1 hypothetical protein Agabi119p4_5423 [Agaricus bisporus var. burnettii]
MHNTFFSVALFFGLAINAVFAEFAVSTPDIFACEGSEARFSWEPATPPYNMLLVAAEDPCGDPIMDLGETKNTLFSMKTDKLKEGQKVQLSIEDANGEEGWSGDITVKKCVAASSVASSSVASSSAGASSSGYGGPVAATTLVVTPTVDVSETPAEPSPSVAPVGAANAGDDPFGLGNAASIPRHISVPAVVLSAIAGVIALL